MTATKADLIRWFDEGVERGATHMIVVVDRYDHENFPVYIPTDKDPFHSGKEVITNPREWPVPQGHGIDECYDLRMSKDFQMSERRAHHWEV